MAAKANEQYEHIEGQLQARHILPLGSNTVDCSMRSGEAAPTPRTYQHTTLHSTDAVCDSLAPMRGWDRYVYTIERKHLITMVTYMLYK